MGVPGNANALLLRSAAAAGGYQVSRSLRFSSGDSAYLSKSFGSAGNRKTWTWSAWIKRASLSTGNDQFLFSGGTTNSNTGFMALYLDANHKLTLGTATTNILITTAVYRDTGAWAHVVFTFDATAGTNANKAKIYVNGTEVTTFDTDNRSGVSNQDYGINQAALHEIGRNCFNSARYFDGYMADIWFLDGIAATPSDFAETDATTGQWIPKLYSGSYGTNGFKLNFSDNSNNTASTLGKDTSGNGNNWTPTNFSVTAGAGNDSLVDTPTSYGTDTGAGGEVRGNYATLNPLVTNSTTTLANGNLDATGSEQVTGFSSIVPSSGKWYLEITLGTVGSNSFIGLAGTTPIFGSYCVYGINGFGFANTGWGSPSSTVSGTGAAGDVIGLAFDVDAKTLQFYKNGSSIGTISAFTYPQNWSIGFRCNAAVSTPWVFNFGQRPFAYAAPSGFKALCDTNLPAPVVAKPNTVFDTVLWTGNDTGQTITLPGAFSPDLVWTKMRSAVNAHWLFDVIRGANQGLSSSSTTNELTRSSSVTAFGSTGFTLGTSADVNSSAYTYVAWAWDAGSSTVTNTQGSITSSVRANASAGFSIIGYTGTSSNATVGHGLGVTPGLLICKSRTQSGGSNWVVWHSSFTGLEFLRLNTTDSKQSASVVFNSTAPTSSVISLGTDAAVNGSGNTHIIYAFAPVAGYSSFGSYTSNGSSDGPFVYTGFRPRWIMIKCSSSNQSGNAHWAMYDTSRLPTNEASSILFANLSLYEFSTYSIDILSNGFKIRDVDGEINGGTNTYIYAAFAESPFNYSRAR